MTQSGPALLRGIVPSMNTPFLDDGSVDLAGIRRSVDAVLQAGASAVAAASMFHYTEQTPAGAKAAMQAAGIPVRAPFGAAAASARLPLAA